MSKPESKAERFRQLSDKALGEYAAEKLDAETILANAAKEAAQGFRSYRLALDRSVDLQQTDAAKALKACLQELGFKSEWQRRTVVVASRETVFWELVVDW